MDKSYSLSKRYKKWCPYMGEGYKGENKIAKTNLAYVFHKKKKKQHRLLCYEGEGSTHQTDTHKREGSIKHKIENITQNNIAKVLLDPFPCNTSDSNCPFPELENNRAH